MTKCIWPVAALFGSLWNAAKAFWRWLFKDDLTEEQKAYLQLW